eukprot:TRINITY_DN7319_c0_g1_i1.p1 TRINITY_DN7319_c0_g1~~TRINITY_DN7319_c0_g1_i1.p1  ORF type:complete len:200 (+),score=54.11 TRINITY_DN7319_c0_g1_i1:40-639(+)
MEQQIENINDFFGVLDDDRTDFFDRVENIDILNKDKLSDLDKDDQEIVTEKMADITLRVVDTMRGIGQYMLGDNYRDLVLEDVTVNNNFEEDQRYTRLGLWDFSVKTTNNLTNKVDGYLKWKREENTKIEDTDAMDEEPKSFRDTYVDLIASTFQEELDNIRETEQFTGEHVSMLIDSLEAGVSVWEDEQDFNYSFKKE